MFLQLEAMQNCEGEFVHINVPDFPFLAVGTLKGILLVGKEDPLLIQFLPGPQSEKLGMLGKMGSRG